MMKSLVEAFPQHLREALEIGRKAQFNVPSKKFDNVVISGLGGSGMFQRFVISGKVNELSKNIVVGLELSPATKNAWANLNDKPAEDYNKK
jgi:hypothetical protein